MLAQPDFAMFAHDVALGFCEDACGPSQAGVAGQLMQSACFGQSAGQNFVMFEYPAVGGVFDESFELDGYAGSKGLAVLNRWTCVTCKGRRGATRDGEC